MTLEIAVIVFMLESVILITATIALKTVYLYLEYDDELLYENVFLRHTMAESLAKMSTIKLGLFDTDKSERIMRCCFEQVRVKPPGIPRGPFYL